MLISVVSDTEDLPGEVQFKTFSNKTEHLNKVIGFNSTEYKIFQDSHPRFGIVISLIPLQKQVLLVAQSPLLSSIPLGFNV